MTIKEEKILNLLKGLIDPELMVNIVDLGLVYKAQSNEPEKKIIIEMTLTSPGCPLGEVIQMDANELLKAHYRDFEIEINIVWEPAWNTDMLSPSAKAALER